MINVSDEFKQLMTERQDFKCNAEVTLANGTVLPLGEDDFSIDNNSLVDAAGTNTIPLGVALSRNVQLEIMNDDDHLSNYDFFGAKIRLYLTFELLFFLPLYKIPDPSYQSLGTLGQCSGFLYCTIFFVDDITYPM